ncbi:hypothetical protein PROFUN_00032 [Planoprotostelium fungivorum]|uniref:Charged multivesicular body protein 7 n=1 Tax=Planoprotostelium fungivorum TaxID=1890364 RepID=A0A2P6P0H1_9EUKA|nr:hypothetical protein PROFUN_00032 [Planoprotostelium fungivorum]
MVGPSHRDTPTFVKNTSSPQATSVFFSELPSKDDRPEAWDARIKSWTQILEEWSQLNNKFIFTIEGLADEFCKDGLRPICLAPIVDKMSRDGLLTTPQQILSYTESWTWWIIRKTISAVASPIRSPGTPSKSTKFVMVNLLRRKAQSMLEANDGHLTTVKKLKNQYVKEVMNVCPTPNELSQGLDAEHVNLCLHYLAPKGQGVKFTSDRQGLRSADSEIMSVQLTLDLITEQMNQMEEEILLAQRQALKSKQQGQTNTALMHLKRSKHLQCIRDKRQASMANLEILIAKMEEFQTDEQIAQAMQIGVDGLKIQFKKLNVDQVENIREELDEVLADQREVDQAIAGANEAVMSSAGVLVDDEELERELEGLMKEEVLMEAKRDEDFAGQFKMPSVPTHSPIRSPDKRITAAEADDMLRDLQEGVSRLGI